MDLMPTHGGQRRCHIHDPFDELLDYESLLRPPHDPFHDQTRQLPSPGIEWKETPEAYMFRTDLPGFKKEEIEVQVEDCNVEPLIYLNIIFNMPSYVPIS